MEWTWDDRKAEVNYAKHRVLFATAAVALDDPDAYWEEDWHPDGDRLRTVAIIGILMLLIIHTDPDERPALPDGSSARGGPNPSKEERMSEQRYSAEIEANLRELAAIGDEGIDTSDIPEVTDWSGFRSRAGEWHQKDRRFVMDVGEDVARWFGEHAPSGEDWREGAKQVLRDFIKHH